MRRLAPLMEALRGLATRVTRAAISWGSARRAGGLARGPLMGVRVAVAVSELCVWAKVSARWRKLSVRVGPGLMVLAVTPVPDRSLERLTVRLDRAALVAE